MGRGGAAFPTGRKWDAVAKQSARPHYLICNADESEPGTFKDRVLLDGDPFAIVEAMTIAGFATGCERGFLYIRGEYPLGAERIQHAIDESRAHGFLGDDILGRGVRFDIEIRRGAGAYICGEETAIFNSIEGYRGEPRNKPPFPAQAGLFGLPTVVNNVETLANIPSIVLNGGAAFAQIGTEQSTGTKLFCLQRKRREAGRLRGAVRQDASRSARHGGRRRRTADRCKRSCSAARRACSSGPTSSTSRSRSRARAPRRRRSAPASSSRSTTRSTCAQILLRIASFFRDESCGQCVPCRVGTVRQEEALYRIASGKTLGGVPQEVALLDEIGLAMKDASICGLGQTAYAAIESAIHRVGVFNGTEAHVTAVVSVRSFNCNAQRSRPIKSRRTSTRTVTLTIDGQAGHRRARARRFSTACREIGIEIPTLCFLETLHPVNACRVCVVEVEGARVLVPSCSRAVEEGMVVHTDSARVKHSRKLVLELLASSVDLSTTPDVARVDRRTTTRSRSGSVRRRRRRRRARATRDRRAITRRRIPRSPRRSPSRRRSTTICTCATTRSAFSATSASRRADRIIRTRSRSPSPAAGSTRTSRRSSPFRFPSRRACTAATASRCVRRAR